jgi:N-acetyl-gamma-glutamyl-phosphate reductase
MHKNALPSIAVLGGSGYVGRELLGLLARHQGVTVALASSESEQRIGDYDALPLAEVEKRWGDVDVVFSCLPHGVSAPALQRATAGHRRIVDLSADLRMSDRAVYGLTEVYRNALADAHLVANPGCYPTASLLSVLPFARAGVVDTARTIVIDAASGVSGAGRHPRRGLLFGEVAEDFRAYGAGNEHRHLGEITGQLLPVTGPMDVIFTPHLLPVKRGILATIHVPVVRELPRGEAEAILLEAYSGEPCVRVLRGAIPRLQDVVYRNLLVLGVTPVRGVAHPTITIFGALDNLVKGAAGQAVQNMNVMLGFSETCGLTC